MTQTIVELSVTLFDKAVLSLKRLMGILGIEFFYKQILKMYAEQTEADRALELVVQLMNRCRKMYDAVQQICLIYKLNGGIKKIKSQLQELEELIAAAG